MLEKQIKDLDPDEKQQLLIQAHELGCEIRRRHLEARRGSRRFYSVRSQDEEVGGFTENATVGAVLELCRKERKLPTEEQRIVEDIIMKCRWSEPDPAHFATPSEGIVDELQSRGYNVVEGIEKGSVSVMAMDVWTTKRRRA